MFRLVVSVYVNSLPIAISIDLFRALIYLQPIIRQLCIDHIQYINSLEAIVAISCNRRHAATFFARGALPVLQVQCGAVCILHIAYPHFFQYFLRVSVGMISGVT